MLTAVLVSVALLIAFISWAGVSSATSGVAGLCTACFLAILARMGQARAHHDTLLEAIRQSRVSNPAPRSDRSTVDNPAR